MCRRLPTTASIASTPDAEPPSDECVEMSKMLLAVLHSMYLSLVPFLFVSLYLSRFLSLSL